MKKPYVKKGYSRCGSNPNSQRRGVRHHNAKLTPAKVRAIRRRSPHDPVNLLARDYKVSISTISKVINRHIWVEVE